MDWLMAAWVGGAGGASMDAVDVINSLRWHHKMPWKVRSDTIDPPPRQPDVRPGEEQLPAPGWKAYLVAGALRLFVSGALTGAVAASYPNAMNPLVAYAVGLGALSAVQKIATVVPLAVKNTARAALGGMTEEAQQQAQALQQQPLPPSGPGQANGVLPAPQTGTLPAGSPPSPTGVTVQQGMTEPGGPA
ncbi:hypothetical protein [Actinacidiphila glaucinigra]|uniref:hypothetical protein n=1 Tax=Actinacidiphila glaucinigra TaxID=235986 RepID=UPI00371AA487